MEVRLSPQACRSVGSWNCGPMPDRSVPPPSPPHHCAHLHGTGCVAGITTLHILHLAGVHMWDRHLLELLYLRQEEEQGRGSGLATTQSP